MTDEANDQKETETFTKEQVQEMIAGEVAALKKKNEELLGEKKTAAQRAEELEQERQRAEEERQREKGEFKSLYEKTQAELDAERQAARQFREQVQAKEIDGEAYKLAASLSKDTKRAELLASLARQYARYTEEGVAFEVGGIPVEPGKLAEKLRSDYPFLADGSGASGGGASGGKGGGAASKKFGEYSGSELAAIRRDSPDEYERLKREHYGT